MNIKHSDLLWLKSTKFPDLLTALLAAHVAPYHAASVSLHVLSHICLLLIAKPAAEKSCHQMNFTCEYKPATPSFGTLPSHSSDFGKRKRNKFCSGWLTAEVARRPYKKLFCSSWSSSTPTFLLFLLGFPLQTKGTLQWLAEAEATEFEVTFNADRGFFRLSFSHPHAGAYNPIIVHLLILKTQL